MNILKRIAALAYRKAHACHHCHREPGLMGGQYATEYRVYCWECWRRVILHKPDVMQPQPNFTWPFF